MNSTGIVVVIFRHQEDQRRCLRRWSGFWPQQLDGGNAGAMGLASSSAAPAATDAAMKTYGAAAEPVSLVAAAEAPSEPVAAFERSTFGGSLGDGGAAPAEVMDVAAAPNGGDELMQGEDGFSRPLDIMAASGRAAARRRTNGIPPWQRRRSIQPAKYERGDK